MRDLPTNDPTVSRLKIHSYGIAAADKLRSSRFVEVTPVEDFPMLSGVISSNATQYTASGVDAQGQSYSESIKQTVTYNAEWLPMGGSNRTTAPDVRQGERLALYRMGDSDKYYWTTFTDDLHLRKLETVIYAWSASTAQSGPTANTDNAGGQNTDASYFLEISTHDKLVHFHTSQANGEVCAYDVQINPGQGVLQFMDSIGNVFMLDTKNLVMQMQNADGTAVVLSKKNLYLNAPETLYLQAKNAKFLIGSEWDIQSPTSNHNGNWNVLGAFGLNGDMVTAEGSGGVGTPGTGRIQIAGDTELLGNMDIKGKLTAVTIEASTSVTAPNLKYN